MVKDEQRVKQNCTSFLVIRNSFFLNVLYHILSYSIPFWMIRTDGLSWPWFNLAAITRSDFKIQRLRTLVMFSSLACLLSISLYSIPLFCGGNLALWSGVATQNQKMIRNAIGYPKLLVLGCTIRQKYFDSSSLPWFLGWLIGSPHFSNPHGDRTQVKKGAESHAQRFSDVFRAQDWLGKGSFGGCCVKMDATKDGTVGKWGDPTAARFFAGKHCWGWSFSERCYSAKPG